MNGKEGGGTRKSISIGTGMVLRKFNWSFARTLSPLLLLLHPWALDSTQGCHTDDVTLAYEWVHRGAGREDPFAVVFKLTPSKELKKKSQLIFSTKVNIFSAV